MVNHNYTKMLFIIIRILISVMLFIIGCYLLFKPRAYHLNRLKNLEESWYHTKTINGRYILEKARKMAANDKEKFLQIRLVGIVLIFIGCVNLSMIW